MGSCYQEKIHKASRKRINYSMSLFEFKHYGMPTGQVFIPTHEEEGPPFEGHNIDQYIQHA
mgnify:FL=1